MEKLSEEAEKIMIERFGGDSLISLATAEDNTPYVRTVNAHYEDGAFYVITYGLSNKIRQIGKNPVVAISGDWFTAHGRAENLGWFQKPENAAMAETLEKAFREWIHNGHNDFDDENTCILKIRLTEGVLFSHGTKYEIDFQQ